MGKLALVTGASSGLGKALCIALAQRQIPLILTGRNAQALRDLAATLPVSTHVIAVDLSKQEERKKLIALIHEKQPDLLINNAGFGLYGPVLSHPPEAWSDMTAVNIDAVMELTIAAATVLKDSGKWGTILNISSAAAFFSYPTFAVYAASKAFVHRFSEGMDAELSLHGIRVLTSCPGQIDTPFPQHASGGSFDPKQRVAMPVEKAVRLILKQIDRGKSVAIIDGRYRWAIALSRLIPQRWLMAFLKKRISQDSGIKSSIKTR